MNECRLCLSIEVNGEPTTHYYTQANGRHNSAWLCPTCEDELRALGVELKEVGEA